MGGGSSVPCGFTFQPIDESAQDVNPNKQNLVVSQNNQSFRKARRGTVVLGSIEPLPEGARRHLALVAHNRMKPTMRAFVQQHANILQHYRITGTGTTVAVVKDVLGSDCKIGRECSSGPLGGDAQIAAQIVGEVIGAVIFMVDPLTAHPHQADVDSFQRLCHIYDIPLALNLSTAQSLVLSLSASIDDSSVLPSMYKTLESPVVLEYTREQNATKDAVISGAPK